MRIHRLQMRNFKCFEDRTLELHPQFTLLVGENGAGKTTVLDALAIAMGIWLAKPPDSTLANSGRSIQKKEIRLVWRTEGDRSQFFECRPVSITAQGEISGRSVVWERLIRQTGTRTTNANARDALEIVERHFAMDQAGEHTLSPVVAYYGAGRAWLPSRDRRRKGRIKNVSARRWGAFYDCFEERIRLNDLQDWFRREAVAFVWRGSWRPGYNVVKDAILRCLPDADDVWYDGDRGEIVVSLGGQSQPFPNLSGGQRMMVSLVADLATKAVMQNTHLVTDDQMSHPEDSLPIVLKRTPGLVLIDELDVHLHPKWQRRVVRDLKETFPEIQFVCTSHSPFIIQSLEEGELEALDRSGSQLLEYTNKSIEDIAEGVQQVESPQQSLKAQELTQATERYFTLLQETEEGGTTEELRDAEAAYRAAVKRYSANPGLNAILELQAFAKRK
ncbi:MAG: AAA family ATPase [Candidatus Tectomicrobia bacterium]|nr:AAA family ATPase [Candidatus Tectomicrobia bacterium]